MIALTLLKQAKAYYLCSTSIETKHENSMYLVTNVD